MYLIVRIICGIYWLFLIVRSLIFACSGYNNQWYLIGRPICLLVRVIAISCMFFERSICFCSLLGDVCSGYNSYLYLIKYMFACSGNGS